MVKALDDFVPILVDGDTEKDVCRKFSVTGYPNTRFLDASGKELGTIGGYVPADGFLQRLEAARTQVEGEIPLMPVRPRQSKPWKAVVDALGKEDYPGALKALGTIEKAKPGARELRAVARARERIAAAAKEALEKALALADEEGKAQEALAALEKVAKDFKGLPEAKEAADKVAEIRKSLAPPKGGK